MKYEAKSTHMTALEKDLLCLQYCRADAQGSHLLLLQV